MKNIAIIVALIAVVAGGLWFSQQSDAPMEKAAEAAGEAVEATTEAASEAAEATTEAASEAAEAVSVEPGTEAVAAAGVAATETPAERVAKVVSTLRGIPSSGKKYKFGHFFLLYS